MYHFLKILPGEPAVFIDSASESLHRRLVRQGQPRRHLMSPVSHEKLFTGGNLLVHVIGFYRASAAFYPLFSLCQNESGFSVLFPHLSGDNSRKALVAVRQIDHQDPVLLKPCIFHLAYGRTQSFLRHLLPAVVQVFQILRNGNRLPPVL